MKALLITKSESTAIFMNLRRFRQSLKLNYFSQLFSPNTDSPDEDTPSRFSELLQRVI